MATDTSKVVWHVLDFFCDDADSCALTVLVRGFRFHVIADKDEFCGSCGNTYDRLVHNVRSKGNNSTASTSSSDKDETDSGIDVSDDTRSDRKVKVDPEEALQRFMLEPLLDEFNKLSDSEEEETLQEWYNGPTYFYNLALSSAGDIKATQLEPTQDLQQRMAKLKPEMALPKYMTDKFEIPLYQASELTVVSTSDQPPCTPFHPCRVRKNNTEQALFLKVVDTQQPQPVKRELNLLYQVMELKLNKEINVPSLEGLVMFDDAEETKSRQKRIMGFLQTDIPGAQPLTGMLDPSVDQAKRERWAKEAERAKEVLHKHEIVWGDAKADNFVVDKDDRLWIIDFGGSYTEGWVDPEMNETVEGDDMGVERIVNALEDPVANTYDPEKEDKKEEEDVMEKPSVTFSPDKELKRKRESSDRKDEEVDRNGKAQRLR